MNDDEIQVVSDIVEVQRQEILSDDDSAVGSDITYCSNINI
jgi:hypothetical protein